MNVFVLTVVILLNTGSANVHSHLFSTQEECLAGLAQYKEVVKAPDQVVGNCVGYTSENKVGDE